MIFCLVFCIQIWSNDIENTLKTLNLTPKIQERLKSAMVEFYAEKHAYQQNVYRIRNRLLLDLKNKSKVDLERYKQAFKEVSDEYIEARIIFYHSIVEILDTEQMNKLLEKIWE